MKFLRILILYSFLIVTSQAYRPVIMMHGVDAGESEMDTIASMLLARDNTTAVTSLPIFQKSPSSWDHSLQIQVDGMIDAVRKLVSAEPEIYQDGYHFVCKSQGGLTCRAVIEAMDDHNVLNFVSLAGPQSGVFGTAFLSGLKWLPEWLVDFVTDNLYIAAYTFLGQFTSVGDMWRDPNHLEKFLKDDKFIPKYTEYATADMKSNFLKLQHAVFCVGSGPAYDGGIEPWQTGAWGSVVDGVMLNMTQRDFYINDTFGLRTLDETGRLNLTIVPNVTHGDWTFDERIIEKYVLPWCT